MFELAVFSDQQPKIQKCSIYSHIKWTKEKEILTFEKNKDKIIKVIVQQVLDEKVDTCLWKSLLQAKKLSIR